MQRKPGFPVANCSIKMPDNTSAQAGETLHVEEDPEQLQRRQQLINYGHSQWGFNNWSWTVTKQDLDFVDFSNGKYCAGVVAFVSVTVKSLDIHRENIGYATSLATTKGFAIYKSRKCAVTNALRETLLSFGGSVAADLIELLDAHKLEAPAHVPPVPPVPPVAPAPMPVAPAPMPVAPAPVPVAPVVPVPDENNQNVLNKPTEPKNAPLIRNLRKEECTANSRPPIKNPVNPPPVAKAHPMPAPPANRLPPRPAPPPAAPLRPNSNVSFVLQPVMPPLYAPPRPAVPPHVYPNYYEYTGPWHFYDYDRHHGNVNLNFNIPPKNLVVNGRAGAVECKNACRQAEGEPVQYAPSQGPGCWIKPTIFYDGFWTEQKVKKWVAEQVEKQFPEDLSHKSSSPSSAQCETTPKP